MASIEITRAERERRVEALRQKVINGEDRPAERILDPWYGTLTISSERDILRQLEKELADSSKWILKQ